MGSSPAQSHSTRHTRSAPIPVGHGGDDLEPWDGHPKVAPRLLKCHIFRAVPPLPFPILSITSLPQGPGSPAQLPPGGAQQPETKQRWWGLGSARNVLFQQSNLPSLGWLGEVPRPSATASSQGSPQPASESEYSGTMEQEGRKEGRAQPDKGSKPHPRSLFLPPGAVP